MHKLVQMMIVVVLMPHNIYMAGMHVPCQLSVRSAGPATHERAASGATSQPLLQVLGLGSTNTTPNTIPHPLLHVPAALGGSSSTLVTRAARHKHPKVAHGGFGRMLYSKGPWSHPWPFIQPKPLDFCSQSPSQD